MTDPYYADEYVTLYNADCRDVLSSVSDCVVVTDPPYPNKAGHFEDGIQAALDVFARFDAPRWFVFWHSLAAPAVRLPLVAHHIWHRTNTNRPDNYEAIYEFANEPERASRVFPFPVVYPGLTGCTEATGHPTQKSERLMQSLISLRGGAHVVFDPFAGSGSTLRAAKDLNRRAIGVEINEQWCELAAHRLTQSVFDFGESA